MVAPRRPSTKLTDRLARELEELSTHAKQADLSTMGRRQLLNEIHRAESDLALLHAEVDPIKRPKAVFDPGNPKTISFFVALGLVSQPRRPMADFESFYGAGVYAIYYNGDFPLYREISGTETPIYIGKAISGREGALTPVEQGTALSNRLTEHRRNIQRASDSLRIEDFECRALVVQSGWEATAEDYLIRLFKPIWNKEVKLIFGFGKHGDSAETRRNKRSPWDVLHQGRNRAAGSEQDSKSQEKITAELREHFNTTKTYKTLGEVLDGYTSNLKQT